MAELLVKISYIAFAGAVVCLILAVILFIKFKIPTVIGDLSGKNAIQQMRETNSQKGNPAFKPGKKNEKHKKLTEELTFKKKENVTEAIRPETGLLKETMAASQESSSDETELLVSEETAILGNVTESLESETEILTQQKTVHMKMLDDIMLVHTKERIS